MTTVAGPWDEGAAAAADDVDQDDAADRSAAYHRGRYDFLAGQVDSRRTADAAYARGLADERTHLLDHQLRMRGLLDSGQPSYLGPVTLHRILTLGDTVEDPRADQLGPPIAAVARLRVRQTTGFWHGAALVEDNAGVTALVGFPVRVITQNPGDPGSTAYGGSVQLIIDQQLKEPIGWSLFLMGDTAPRWVGGAQ